MAIQKKASILAVLKILIEESDESHILTTEQLRDKLQKQYELDIERRTLYANIRVLKDFGFSICDYEDNKKGYYLKKRILLPEEAMLLCNSIHASNFISADQSDCMIQKILDTQSRYFVKDYHDDVYLKNTHKTHNEQLMENIKLVPQAIHERKKIRFSNTHYTLDNEPKKKAHTVSPLAILYKDERPYMIAAEISKDNQEKIVHFRLDRMCDVKITDENVSSNTEIADAYEYAKDNPFMFSGEKIKATLRCSASILDPMSDMFGPEIFKTRSPDNTSFEFTIQAPKQTILILASQYLNAMEITWPDSLRQEMATLLKERLKAYQKK